MRSKIKVDGKFYKPVKWLKYDSCNGCDLEANFKCINNHSDAASCDYDGEFAGHIFIGMDKESKARYVLARLEAA
jgi:hypothetical protein